MDTVLFDCHIYDKLADDRATREAVRRLVDQGTMRVIATPMLVDELRQSPFGGVPEWFPVALEAESVTVLDFAPLGMTKLGDGHVYTAHRGSSKKIPDAILADSASSLADVLVSDDHRCRERLKKISTRCKGLDYRQFCEWLQTKAATDVSPAEGGLEMAKTESALSIYKAAAVLRDHERKKLGELITLVTTALQREKDPETRKQLEESLAEAQQALEADRRNP